MPKLSAKEIISALKRLALRPEAADRLLLEAVRLLKENFDHYDWVGVYILEGDELILGPFLGKPSPHTRIKLDSGICGAAASEGRTVIVDDVNADPRYLACSLETRSEIVVPIFKKGKVVGEIDIDSHTPAAFGEQDRSFLERVAQILSTTY